MIKLVGKIALLVLLGSSLSACFTSRRSSSVNQSNVQDAVYLYDFENDQAGLFTEAWGRLTSAEMELWIDGVYEAEMEAHRELEANPYLKHEVSTKNKDPGIYRVTPDVLEIRQAEIEKHYEFMKTFNGLAVELFGKSMNQLDGEEWEAVEAKYARLE